MSPDRAPSCAGRPHPLRTPRRDYGRTRQPDPRIARRIRAALGDARTVVNVGAGLARTNPRPRGDGRRAGGGDDRGAAARGRAVRARRRRVAAVSPTTASTPPWACSPCSTGPTSRAGLRELRRVAARRVVLFTWDPRVSTTPSGSRATTCRACVRATGRSFRAIRPIARGASRPCSADGRDRARAARLRRRFSGRLLAAARGLPRPRGADRASRASSSSAASCSTPASRALPPTSRAASGSAATRDLLELDADGPGLPPHHRAPDGLSGEPPTTGRGSQARGPCLCSQRTAPVRRYCLVRAVASARIDATLPQGNRRVPAVESNDSRAGRDEGIIRTMNGWDGRPRP